MSKDTIQLWVGVAWAMALITVLAAIFLCVGYGTVEVPGRYGATDTLTNWPLITGAAVTAVYAVLFAVAMSALRITVLNSRTALELVIKMTGSSKTHTPGAGDI